ncbi:MAG TPA: glycosyltransferase family 4 protein [Puia sp.]|nr:glycosyltransferase family 4 protein [Puia sp.]
MKVLCIHTYYMQRGGEDAVFENELRLLSDAGCETLPLLFNNRRFAALKFLFFFFNPLSFWKTCRAIRRWRPDIVHVHNWFFSASPAVFLAARCMGVPVVHTVHNFRILCPSSFLFVRNELFTDCMTRIFPLRAITRKIYRGSALSTAWLLIGTRLHYFLRTWQKIDLLICLTDPARQMICQSLLKIDPHRIAIKPNFFKVEELPVPQGMVPARRCGFLFVGRLSPEKGIQLLLDSFRNSPYTLRIVGDGPLRAEVEACAAEYSNIQYLGLQTKQQIIGHLRSAEALVFTTIGFEQFGLVIIEAFSCGTPVIGPDTGSPAELIIEGYNGLHFKTGSVPDLRRKIRYWHSLPKEVREVYSENSADTYGRYYTPEINLRLLSNIYKKVLHENNANLQLPHQRREVPGLH